MPASLIVIAVWVAVWIYVSATNSAPKLCGKGISNIGGEFYRFLTAGLTHECYSPAGQCVCNVLGWLSLRAENGKHEFFSDRYYLCSDNASGFPYHIPQCRWKCRRFNL